MSKCPKCGQNVESKFCPDCGINVSETLNCPKCGSVMKSRFCPDCGYEAQSRKQPNKFVEKLKNIFTKCKEFFLANMKKCIIIGASIIAAIIVSIVLIVSLSNVFRVGKVSKIDLGMSMDDVKDILGEPHTSEEGVWCYFDDSVLKKIEKAERLLEKSFESEDEDKIEDAISKYDEIYAEIEEMTYRFIMVRFDFDNKVAEVFFDKNHKYDEENIYATDEKLVKNVTLEINSMSGYTIEKDGNVTINLASNPAPIKYVAKFKDGSYYRNSTYQSLMKISLKDENCELEWNDPVANYKTSKPINKTGTIVDGVLTGWQADSEKIVLPEGILIIENSVFKDNTTIKEITLPDSLEIINDNAFNGCTALRKIVIPNNVTEIKASAFFGCTAIESITLGESISKIGYKAFSGCTSAVLVMNSSKLKLEKGSQNYGCVAENAIIVYDGTNANSTLEIAENGLYFLADSEGAILLGYNGIETDVVLPETYNGKSYAIYSDAFAKNSKITSVKFPSFISEISDYMFNACTALTNVDLPDNIISIGEYAFNGCTSLKSISIGKGVTTIGRLAFRGCTTLEEVKFNATEMNDLTEKDDLFSLSGTDGEGITIKIGKDVTKIPAYLFGQSAALDSFEALFRGKSKIKNLIFEENSICESIGAYAFANNSSLENIIIPETIKQLGELAFKDCHKVAEIKFNAISVECGSKAFWGVGSSTDGVNIIIGNKVTEISDNLFSLGRSNNIASIVFEQNSVCKSIGSHAFDNCSKLKSVTIPDSVISISDAAFYNCVALEDVTIPSGLTFFGNNVFSGCDKLSYKENQNVYYLGNLENPYLIAMKAKDETLDSITINIRTRFIHDSAFSGLKSLTSIDIPKSVRSIGTYVFSECTSLKNVTISEGVTSIGAYSFSGCTVLENITIPNSMLSIGEKAFDKCDSLVYNEYEKGYYIGNSTNPYLVLMKLHFEVRNFFVREDTKIIYRLQFSRQECSAIISDNIIFITKGAISELSRMTIYCEAVEQPSAWGEDLNSLKNLTVIWGYTGE